MRTRPPRRADWAGPAGSMDAPCASAAKPPTGRKMKARAPPPPGKPAAPTEPRGQSPPRSASPVSQQSLLHLKDSLRDRALDLTVVLPSGLEKRSMVNGSHAMMDLLVDLCLQNHLNPSHHALEIRSSESQQPLSFKPNTLVGTLDVHTVFLKEKATEEKAKPVKAPKMPEKSVRLVVNYLRTQKAVVRVSPEVPLQSLLPVICAKCDVSPEHVVLLRDNVAGEELELSKSLSELGIKELYAWDNKRETFRKASLGSDETEKEKRKFLGFFKVNKRSNSKVEPLGLAGVDSDEDASRMAPGRGSNGCLTTPSSPSVNSRSVTLGPSLSLSDISGVSIKSDVKKRRAPPPPCLPGAGPPVQDKASEKTLSLGSQMDLQRKKRRAPAPPPPSPRVPSRMEDREENRKSAMGVGRQVPQKPPRGAARGPPQLVLPPPPPYPPPDADVAEPLGFPGEGAAPEASDLRPSPRLPRGPGCPCSADGVPPAPSEAEETVSVGSCFASEDTTEDSGVVSSPSDIVSLDSQHDSTKSREKWATDQEDGSDQDPAGPPELGPPKSPAWERNGYGLWHSRAEKAAAAPEDARDLLVAGYPQADLDEDPEDMEASYGTDTSSLTSFLNGESGHCTQDTFAPDADPDVIPVTFIGEVDDPVELGLFSNRNNNAGSCDPRYRPGSPAHLPLAPDEAPQPRGRKRAEGRATPTPPHDVGTDVRPAPSDSCADSNPSKAEPRVAPELHQRSRGAKEKGGEHSSAAGGRARAVEAPSSPPRKEDGDDWRGIWGQRGRTPGGSFGLKYGLTTYKIVPPKSERRCYDRGLSLSAGAIKIDELGNLVGPRPGAGRASGPTSGAPEMGPRPGGSSRELRGSDASGKRWGQGPATTTAAATATPPAAARSPALGGRGGTEPRAPDPTRTSPPQLSAHQGGGRHLQEGPGRPLSAATCPTNVPAAPAPQVLFLKPQRRTSSQYVASAIAKRIGPPRALADPARKREDAERAWEGGGRALSGQPQAARDNCALAGCPGPLGRVGGAQAPRGDLPGTREEPAGGAPPRGLVSSSPGTLSSPDCPVGTHIGAHVPRVTDAQPDRDSEGRSHGFSGKLSPRNRRPSEGLGRSEPPPPGSGDGQAPGRPPVNGSGGLPPHSEPPRAARVSGENSCTALQPEDKPPALCPGLQDPDGTLPPSIFGPKKKFRPVVQRPAPKDTSLHSALMEAIHAAGGKDRLRKTAELGSEGGPRKLSYVESESEHSALLAAIRGHRGACSLRKVTSCASEELRSFREAACSVHGLGPSGLEGVNSQPPPALPPPAPPAAPAPPAPRTVSQSSFGPLSSSGDARQALMDAIRSGTGAARLRKVPLLV